MFHGKGGVGTLSGPRPPSGPRYFLAQKGTPWAQRGSFFRISIPDTSNGSLVYVCYHRRLQPRTGRKVKTKLEATHNYHDSVIFVDQLRPSGCNEENFNTCGVLDGGFLERLQSVFDRLDANVAEIRLCLGWK